MLQLSVDRFPSTSTRFRVVKQYSPMSHTPKKLLDTTILPTSFCLPTTMQNLQLDTWLSNSESLPLHLARTVLTSRALGTYEREEER